MTDHLIDSKAVAQILSVSREQLSAWRREGGGPPWYKIGGYMIRYQASEVREWLRSQRKPPKAGEPK